MKDEEDFDDKLDEWLSVEVGSFNYESNAHEIAIADYKLKKMFNATMEVFIIFEQPEMISLDIKFPETLRVKFTQRALSKDMELLEID